MNRKSPNFAPDRGSYAALSSIVLTLSLIEPAFAQQAAYPPGAVVQPIPGVTAPLQPARATDPLSSAIYTWKTLQESDNFSFASYAQFLVAHPGWPAELVMRKNAERMLRSDGEQPALVVAFFSKYPPMTPAATLRFAEALDAIGRKPDALAAARRAWISGALVPEDENRLLTRFSSAIQSGDHDERMEHLLWARSTANAARQMVLVSPEKRNMFNARLGFQIKAPDASVRESLVSAAQRNDAGFIADRVFWLRSSGQNEAARSFLAQSRRLNAPPVDPGKWLDMLEGSARSAAGEQQWSAALAIARQLELTYPSGTIVRDRPFGERDSWTNIAWLGGTAAMQKLGRPGDAIRMFELYGQAARSPQTRAKGFYWAGRAAEAAGKRDQATQFYNAAAEYFDQFHGQLAHERLGRPIAPPANDTTVEISGAERDAFERSEVVRAAILLGQMNNWQDQTRFVRAIAANIEGPANHLLAEQLATRIDRPDLGLLVGRSAREDGLPGYFRPSFPMMRVPDEHRSNWTMIHAITRQESQFDRAAMSRVGARGLMQLMPGTARQTAPSAGVTYDLGRLTSQPQDNIRLGSTYFGQLMTQFNGSYILAVAAYNAGPGNVNKWLRANGDPRLPGVDPLDWIEAIPLTETRGYVQRVLENAVIYDLLNPQRTNRVPVPLSAFLGRSQIGYGSR